MRSILHKATCQWPLPSSHLLCESPGVIRAPSCIFHHAGSCCWNSSVNGNSRRHDLNKLGLEFLHTAFIYFPSKGSYWKNKYPVHNLLKGSYCTQRQIIILLPYGWGQRGISFLTAIQCCLLAVVFLAVCSLCTARMGKTGFFQQSKIRFALKILPHIQTGQTAILKEGRSWLKKKRPLKSQLMKKTPQQSLWTGQSLQREQGEKQTQSWPNSPHKEPQLSGPSAFCFLQTTPQQKTFPPSWWVSLSQPCWNGPSGEPQETLDHLLKNPSASDTLKLYQALSPITKELHIKGQLRKVIDTWTIFSKAWGSPSFSNQQALHKSPISFTTCRESPAEILLAFKRTRFESD